MRLILIYGCKCKYLESNSTTCLFIKALIVDAIIGPMISQVINTWPGLQNKVCFPAVLRSKRKVISCPCYCHVISKYWFNGYYYHTGFKTALGHHWNFSLNHLHKTFLNYGDQSLWRKLQDQLSLISIFNIQRMCCPPHIPFSFGRQPKWLAIDVLLWGFHDQQVIMHSSHIWHWDSALKTHNFWEKISSVQTITILIDQQAIVLF